MLNTILLDLETPQIVPGGLFDAQPVIHELMQILPSSELSKVCFFRFESFF